MHQGVAAHRCVATPVGIATHRFAATRSRGFNYDKLSIMHKDTLEAKSPNEPLNPLLRVGAVIGCPSSELYNMDCVQGMKHYPDNYFDLAICDPPYGIGLVKTENGSWGIRKPEQAQNASKTFDWDFAKPTKEYIVELFRVSKNQILFGANHYIEVVPYNSPCWLVWDKVNGDSYFADCELAWTSFETATRKIKLQYFGANSHRFGKRIHPTQKPVGLYEYILENYAKQGERILDTHLGSGSSRIACYFKGFDFVGFEIDKEMAEKSDKRFHNEISQQRLF